MGNHSNELAEIVEESINLNNGKGVLFNTITVSDGISMGTQGMKYSLVSREVIADSIETVVNCLGYDGLIAIGGCDKNMPGCLDFKLVISFFINLKFKMGAIKKSIMVEIMRILFDMLKVLKLFMDIPCAPSNASSTSFDKM